MSRLSWVSCAIAVVLILLGLWLVDQSFTESLLCLGMALLAMVGVVLGTPARSKKVTRPDVVLHGRGFDASWTLRKDGSFKIQGMRKIQGQTDEPF